DLVVGTPSGPVPENAVSISGALLASWQPGSLLLGGKAAADGSSIDVRADSVTIGAGTSLTADQIILVANQSLDVQNGATLQTTSAASGTAPAEAPESKTVTLTGHGGTAGAGFLALSDLNWLVPSDASISGAATVAVESGAALSSRGSLSLNGPA